ncbi:MAG TPA: hypothetical protein VGH86_14550 [Phenylobacterium sp.]
MCDRTDATLADPQERTHHICYVSARIESIELLPPGTSIEKGTI